MQTVTSNGVATFDEISAADEPRAGGKAFNCARLQRAGFPVPDGLVVLSTAADDDLEALAGHPWFDTVPAGSVFAVRSSGIGEDGVGESFAGIHQTLLNVARADVPAAVATCRASAHTAQALEYRRGRHLAVDAVQMGSLVQRMVQPIAAGVAFTVNPVTGVETELVINAAFGLGEALVSGQIDPDEFVIDKHTRGVRFRRIGDRARRPVRRSRR